MVCKGAAFEGCRNLDGVVEAVSEARCRAQRMARTTIISEFRMMRSVSHSIDETSDADIYSLYRHIFGQDLAFYPPMALVSETC